ncbi:SIS domain-containing protein [Olsenella sp. Marseille-P4559]|jgi:fructoselysine-6-phosphate deglycase|uniref:SIS domain-containing protein n=1 Tax=Olsenella sp. Marseille-P4559 TaxID=2364795 RepID=UPI0010315B0E|nr:SIS domain-containing protein [Olsenella sp. Marseille-P4559]
MVSFDEQKLLSAFDCIYSRRDEIEAMADDACSHGISNILLSSSGGSQAMLDPFAYLIDAYSSLPVRSVLSAELVLRGCRMLDGRSLAIMSSKSGDTAETVAAAHWLKERGCRIFSIVGRPCSALGEVSDWCFVYEDGRPQELVAYLFLGCILQKLGSFARYDAFAYELSALGSALNSVRRQFDGRAAEYCRLYHGEPYHIWVASGDLWPVCYAYAMCVLEESQWIRTKSVSSPEFFHGTFELLEPGVPLTLLVGEGPTRPLDERVRRFAQTYTDKLTVIDTAEFELPGISGEFRPLLGPIIMNAALQRISKNMEYETGHPLDYRRYYRKVEY